ncbi:EAL domain-containing protein [Aromatoleum sp.]|uniref:EAL domain-containing protein n=1 Tax=Aromatoleum sp. TaxID=2307007 RepID=UPI002FCC9DB4
MTAGLNNKTAVAIATLVGLLALATPIAISIYWAWKQSFDEQMAGVVSLAEDVLRRSDDSADHIAIAFRTLEKAADTNPCSEQNRRLMRRLEIESVHIERLGYAVGNKLVCSSAGPAGERGEGADLGPATYDSGVGTVSRPSVEFPHLAPGSEFLVVTHKKTAYTAVIHHDLPLQVFLDRPEVSLGVFSRMSRGPIVSRGDFDPAWLKTPPRTRAEEFSDGRYLVAIRPSTKYTFSAYAAIPMTSVNEGLRRTAMVLGPIGLLAGVILAFAVFYLAMQQLALPAVLKVALKRNEFFLVYQPIIELRGGRCVGAEALIRWRRPNGEMVRPDVFIPVAESTGLIHEITKRVMELVARDAARLLQTRKDLHVAINLSAIDLETPETSQLIRDLIQKMNVQPKNLIVEATEGGFMQADVARRIMDDIHALNIKIAIDDFGTGYSSLSYLEKFRLDYLKIDKSFVDTMGGETPTSQVAPHIIEMARALKLEMIAEGVETEAQLKYLQQRGVQYAQGWYFAKPMSFAEFATYVAKTEKRAAAA